MSRSWIAAPALALLPLFVPVEATFAQEPRVGVDWCPEKGSPEPRSSDRLRIASWNLANLHAVDGGSTYADPSPSVKRFPVDYERIRCYVRLFDPDILAVQEVDGEEALRRVVDTDVYEVHVSARPRPDGMGGKQNTGFAYKKGLAVQERADFAALDVDNGGLRYGTRIDVAVGSQTLMLMSVHLKSGCFGNSSSGPSCTLLLNQVPILEQWIDDAAAGTKPAIVLGDFNRRFNEAGDTVWSDLDDADPPNSDLLTVTQDMPISCRDNRFTTFIDHIVVDKRSAAFVDRSSFRHVTYRQADEPVWDKISDHCPVVVELWVR